MFYELLKDKKVTICIGDMDTGKTGLVRTVIEEHRRYGEDLIHIDLDMGQSTVGPPTTIGLRIPNGKEYLYFVGNTSPLGVFPEIRKGLLLFRKILDSITGHRAIVDTAGIVRGDYAWLLKKAEIDILKADMVLIIDRAGESFHVVERIKRRNIDYVVLEPGEEVRTKQISRRNQYRKALFEEYFQNARKARLATGNRSVTTMGLPQEAGQLIGLLDKDEFLVCLALFLRAMKDKVEVLAPKCNPRKVETIKFGRYAYRFP